MQTITQISAAMRDILLNTAEELGGESGFVQRRSKMGASAFVQAVVFGVMGNPCTSYTHLCQSANLAGVKISSQGLEQRFTPAAARLLLGVLEALVSRRVAGSPSQIALLQRFNGVYVRDSSCVSLPKALCGQWPGVGSQQGPTAGIKLHVRLNLNTGELAGPVLTSARRHDNRSPFHEEEVPAGGLRIADLGFFDLEQFTHDDAEGVYWLSRYKHDTVVQGLDGQRLDLLVLLKGRDQLDLPILLGGKQLIPCRLLAQRVPPEVAAQRRRKLRQYGVRKQVSPSKELLALAEWTLLITNVPTDLLTCDEAFILYSVRWQIELLFKLWKHYIKIDEWRTQKPNRILCELYGKLITAVLFHWQCCTAFWAIPARSLFKAIQVFQSFAIALALAIHQETSLINLLQTLHSCIQSCRLNTRRTKPNTCQRLMGVLA